MSRWTDEEWKQWRQWQQQQQPQRPQQPRQNVASSSAGGGLSETRPLPEEWRITEFRRSDNRAHTNKDYSDLVRLANRRLRMMFNQWKDQVEERDRRHAVAIGNAMSSQATMTHLLGRTAIEKANLSVDKEAAEAELRRTRGGRHQELTMATESSKLAVANARAALKTKHAEKMQAERQSQAAYKQKVHKAGGLCQTFELQRICLVSLN